MMRSGAVLRRVNCRLSGGNQLASQDETRQGRTPWELGDVVVTLPELMQLTGREAHLNSTRHPVLHKQCVCNSRHYGMTLSA